jgi:hypothetical protein
LTTLLASAVLALLAHVPAQGAPPARFPTVSLPDGRFVFAHASVSGDPSDVAAAARRADLTRSPYTQIAERRALRGGEVTLGFEAGLDDDLRDELTRALSAFCATLFDRDGWPRPFSPASPLLVLVTRQADVAAVAGWEGRERGLLVRPVVAAGAGARVPAAVVLDLGHQIALLSLRQSAPDAPAWAVESLAESLARRALGLDGVPLPETDPLLADSGSLTSPPAGAAFWDALARRLPRGMGDVREAWEDAGALRGDGSDALLRSLAARVDEGGLPGFLADLMTKRLAAATGHRGAPARRLASLADIAAPGPGPLGWRRVTVRTEEERGGLEILVPDSRAAAAGRAVLFYRGVRGDFDAVSLLPGLVRTIPLSGSSSVHLLLVDGAEGGDLDVRLRRVADYPVALVASGSEWKDGVVQISWRTSSHRDLLGWVLERWEETGEGTLEESGRELVPASDASDTGFAYHVADRDTQPGHRYRYRVYALTQDGVLAEAFETAVVPGR